MDVIKHDVKFEKMFKELENDPEYLKELKDIEDGEKEISPKSKEQEEIESLSKVFEDGEVEQLPSYFDFRLGWGGGDTVKSAPELLRILGMVAHYDWLKAMERGDAPPEDVSPCEGFFHYAKTVEDLIDKNTSDKEKRREDN